MRGSLSHSIPLIILSPSIRFLSFQTVAVLFYSTQCALCTVFTNTLLYVAKVLKELPNLQLSRIDSDKNDLPWQFTMDSVPAFIIFSGQK